MADVEGDSSELVEVRRLVIAGEAFARQEDVSRRGDNLIFNPYK